MVVPRAQTTKLNSLELLEHNVTTVMSNENGLLIGDI